MQSIKCFSMLKAHLTIVKEEDNDFFFQNYSMVRKWNETTTFLSLYEDVLQR